MLHETVFFSRSKYLGTSHLLSGKGRRGLGTFRGWEVDFSFPYFFFFFFWVSTWGSEINNPWSRGGGSYNLGIWGRVVRI